MTSTDFAYWLQGFSELHGAPPTPEQWAMIKEHLALVFTKVTGSETVKIKPPAPTYCTKEPSVADRLCDLDPTARSILESGRWSTNGEKAVVGAAAGDIEVPISEFWPLRLAAQNAGKVFITISPRPHYDPSSTYSFYPFYKTPGNTDARTAQIALLNAIGVPPHREEVYCVVDNALKPRNTKLNHLKGSADHLTSLHPDAPGVVNVGVGEPLFC